MKLAETTTEIRAEFTYVPSTDLLTLGFTTITEDGPHQWDFQFPVQMDAAEARKLAEELLAFVDNGHITKFVNK